MSACKQLYERVWRIVAYDGIEQREWTLDCAFNIHKSADAKSNEMELDIFNLNDKSRAFLRKLVNIELYAGYKQLNGLIFKGIVDNVTHRHDGPTWKTTVVAQDGAIHRRNTFISVSFKKNTPIEDVIKKLFETITKPPEIDEQFKKIDQALRGELELLAKSLKHAEKTKTKKTTKLTEYEKVKREKTIKNAQKSENIKLQRARLVRGSALKKLELYCRMYGLQAIWEDQSISILPIGYSRDNAIVMSAFHGMVGTPEKLENGLKITSLLRPDIKLLSSVALESNAYSGVYTVKYIEHSGSTRDNAWHTILEVEP